MILQDLLLIKTGVDFENIAQVIMNFAILYVPFLVILAGIFELLTSNDWNKLFVKVFFSILLSSQITWFVKTTVPYALEMGSKIIELNQNDHILLTAMKNQTLKDNLKNKGPDVMDLMTEGFSTYQNDIVVNLFIAGSYLLVSLIGVFYSFIYSLLIVLGPTLCLMAIFPMTSKALEVAWASAIWLILTPIILGAVLAICEISGMESLLSNSDINTVANYGYMFIYSCLVFFCPAIASGLITSKGLHTFTDKIQTMVGGGMFLAAMNSGVSGVTSKSIEGFARGYDKNGKLAEGLVGAGLGAMNNPLGRGAMMAGVTGFQASKIGYKSLLNGGGSIIKATSEIPQIGVTDINNTQRDSWSNGFNSIHSKSTGLANTSIGKDLKASSENLFKQTDSGTGAGSSRIANSRNSDTSITRDNYQRNNPRNNEDFKSHQERKKVASFGNQGRNLMIKGGSSGANKFRGGKLS